MCGEKFTLAPWDDQFRKWCSPDCGYTLSMRLKEKKAKQERQAFDRKTKELKARLGPSRKDWNKALAAARSALQLYARIRDYPDPCISCGRSIAEVETRHRHGGHWDGGHFIGKGAAPGRLSLCTWNVHKQCKRCNGGADQVNSGNLESVRQGYTRRLIVKIGATRVEWLQGPHPLLQADLEYLLRYGRIFRKRAKHLKKLRGYE